MDFGHYGQGLFVTKQMLELLEDIRGDKERTSRRILSAPMSVYAGGWLVLYMSDATALDMHDDGC
ncbi:hypothetical protein BGX24_000980 [Mortierella sp. AD032]|nr:hypothetical protein BGX24_000980 [Mortierella sp. AD032]